MLAEGARDTLKGAMGDEGTASLMPAGREARLDWRESSRREPPVQRKATEAAPHAHLPMYVKECTEYTRGIPAASSHESWVR